MIDSEDKLLKNDKDLIFLNSLTSGDGGEENGSANEEVE